VIGCSRFDDIKDLAAGSRFAVLIGKPFEQFRGLIWFERVGVPGAVKSPGGVPLGRIL
jgi:hypothetical protein